jgi:hypothetical protein
MPRPSRELRTLLDSWSFIDHQGWATQKWKVKLGTSASSLLTIKSHLAHRAKDYGIRGVLLPLFNVTVVSTTEGVVVLQKLLLVVKEETGGLKDLYDLTAKKIHQL